MLSKVTDFNFNWHTCTSTTTTWRRCCEGDNPASPAWYETQGEQDEPDRPMWRLGRPHVGPRWPRLAEHHLLHTTTSSDGDGGRRRETVNSRPCPAAVSSPKSFNGPEAPSGSAAPFFRYAGVTGCAFVNLPVWVCCCLPVRPRRDARRARSSRRRPDAELAAPDRAGFANAGERDGRPSRVVLRQDGSQRRWSATSNRNTKQDSTFRRPEHRSSRGRRFREPTHFNAGRQWGVSHQAPQGFGTKKLSWTSSPTASTTPSATHVPDYVIDRSRTRPTRTPRPKLKFQANGSIVTDRRSDRRKYSATVGVPLGADRGESRTRPEDQHHWQRGRARGRAGSAGATGAPARPLRPGAARRPRDSRRAAARR